MTSIFSYVRVFWSYSRYRLILQLICMLFVSLLEGSSILMLIPLLTAAGLLPVGESDGVSKILRLFNPYVEGTSPSAMLLFILVAYVLLMIGHSWLQRYQAILSMKILQRLTTKLRLRVFRAIIQSKWELFLRKQQSDFSHVLTMEISRITGGTNFFLQLISSLLYLIIQIGLALLISVPFTVFVLISGALLFFFLQTYSRQARTLGNEMTFRMRNFFHEVQTHFQGMKEIKSYGMEEEQLERFQEKSIKLEEAMISFTKMNTKTRFYYKISAAILVSLCIYIAFVYINVQPQELLIIIIVFARIWPHFAGMHTNIQHIYSMLPAFEAVMDLIKECTEEQDRYIGERTSGSIHLKEKIEFRNVSFSYKSSGSSYIFHNIHIELLANQITAIIGHSGAGKSTLIDLLLGLLQPDDGEIYLDGKPLTAEMLQYWRNAIGYVPQDPFLFNGSIRDNLLLMYPNASEEELTLALDAAACDFVKHLPNNIDTIIGDNGVRLSGGERQRIVLARALLRKPRVLILDEATSSLDMENERRIQQAIEQLKGKITIIIVAHRSTTIRWADQIIRLERGDGHTAEISGAGL